MNYSLIKTMDTADGEGLRTAVYFSGCQKAMEGDACPGCHNSIAWDPEYGKEWNSEIEEKVLETLKPSYIKGLSILGGEPFSDFSLDAVLSLAKKTKEIFPDKDIWVWTGYNLDELLKDPNKKEKVKEILKYIDYIVDGPFLQDLKDVTLKYRGSSNQRVLKVSDLTL